MSTTAQERNEQERWDAYVARAVAQAPELDARRRQELTDVLRDQS